MASKKGQGSTSNVRDSQGQRRGIKRFGGEYVKPGMIIVRQVGSHIHPGFNVGCGSDFTIFSKIEGHVKFERMDKKRKRVSVYPAKKASYGRHLEYPLVRSWMTVLRAGRDAGRAACPGCLFLRDNFLTQ